MENLKAVIYIRVSDQSQIDNNSLETQLKTCQDYAKNNKYCVVKVFREEGVSAKHVQTRPAMREMLHFCTSKKNQIDAVIIYKMDRWSRNVEEGLMAESLLAKYGVAILPATEIVEQTPIGKAVRTILMTMSQLDNELKGERVKDNMMTMFRNGFWAWKPRIGYKRPFKTKEENKGLSVVIDEKMGPIIKAIFEKAASTPISKKLLAEFTNSIGFKQVYGKPADGRIIARIIEDTFYFGLMYVEKWDEYSRGKYEPLTTEDIWQKANVHVFGRAKKYKHQDNKLYPLKGLLSCFSCDHNLTSSNPKGTYRQYSYYECHWTKCNNHQRIGTEKAHNDFVGLLRGLRPSERVLEFFNYLVFSEWNKAIDEKKKQADFVEDKIRELEDKLTIIAIGNSKSILTDEEAQERANEIRKEIAILRVEKVDLRIEQYKAESVRTFTKNFLSNIDKLWMQLDLVQKQALQNEVFTSNLIVENGNIRTNGLASTYKLIEALATGNVEDVTLPEFESGSLG